jgi:hypothetical protein
MVSTAGNCIGNHMRQQSSCLHLVTRADFWALAGPGRVPLPVLVKYVALCVLRLVTDQVALMRWIYQMYLFLLMLIWASFTLSQTLLVIWAVVEVMPSWLRSPDVVVLGRASASKSVQAPCTLVPSDGVFGRFDLAALRNCHTF